jgi:hypothetical protein
MTETHTPYSRRITVRGRIRLMSIREENEKGKITTTKDEKGKTKRKYQLKTRAKLTTDRVLE